MLTLTIMIRIGKKYKKIGRGEINFYKKYFQTEKTGIEKWIHFNLFETQIENMVDDTNIVKAVSNQGKIFMKAKFLGTLLNEPQINGKALSKMYQTDAKSVFSTNSVLSQILKNNLKSVPVRKDKVNANKTEAFRSIIEHNNEFLKNIKNKKISLEDLYEDVESDSNLNFYFVDDKKGLEFNDRLSDISTSIIDGTEEMHLETDKVNLELESFIDQIKVYVETKLDEK